MEKNKNEKLAVMLLEAYRKGFEAGLNYSEFIRELQSWGSPKECGQEPEPASQNSTSLSGCEFHVKGKCVCPGRSALGGKEKLDPSCMEMSRNENDSIWSRI